MDKLKLSAAVILMCGAVAALWLQHSLNEKLRSENEVLKAAIAELKGLQEVGHSPATGQILSQEQLDELLKLRDEVTRLREQTNQIGALFEANQKLASSLKEAKVSGTEIHKEKGPDDALPQDVHPRDTWAFRGYTTPEATMESICWALANGDKAAFLGAFSPGMQAHLEKDLDGKDFIKGIKPVNNLEFRILDREMLPDDKMMLTVYATHKDENGEDIGGSQKTLFQKIGGEWKLTEESQH